VSPSRRRCSVPLWTSIARHGIAAELYNELLRTTQVVTWDTRVEMMNSLELQATVEEIQPCRANTGIPYAIFTFYDGNKEVISRLGDVAKQVRLMEECRKSIAASYQW
jgi:hypothetical protein